MRISIEWRRFLEWLAQDREVVTTNYYTQVTDQNTGAYRFQHALKGMGYNVLTPTKATMDIDHLIMQEILEISKSNSADVIVVVSGDGAYLNSLEIAIEKNIDVEVVCVPIMLNATYHTVGIKVIDPTTHIDDIADQAKTRLRFPNIPPNSVDNSTTVNNQLQQLIKMGIPTGADMTISWDADKGDLVIRIPMSNPNSTKT
jgi:hypothetical protein